MHLFVGHEYGASTPFGKVHRKHHAQKDYFETRINKVKSALKIGTPMAIIGALVLGAESGLAFAVGFIGAYGFYEYLHYTLHVKAPTTFYGRWARRHHFYHHFENPSFNHGVTSPLWDLVFGTYTNPGTVRVPRKFAMRWLINEEEAVWPNLVNDYSLKGRR